MKKSFDSKFVAFRSGSFSLSFSIFLFFKRECFACGGFFLFLLIFCLLLLFLFLFL
jgi:hypothetical protein